MRRMGLPVATLVMAMVAASARGYPVGPPLTLEKVAEQSDLVIKAKAVATRPVKDDWFTDYSRQGFEVFETTLTTISVVKGEAKETTVQFRHYDVNPKHMVFTFSPQVYHFEPGVSYLVFAAKSDTPGTYRQLWKNHTAAEDLGVFRCRDDKPLPASMSVKDAVWRELTAMLSSKAKGDAEYGISHLNRMCDSGGYNATDDFKRQDVVAVLRPMMKSASREVALAAIGSVGSHSPVMRDACSEFWLAARATNDFLRRGLSPWSGKDNALSKEEIADLLEASESADEQVRAAAIRALLLVKDEKVAERVGGWSKDASAAVRAAVACHWAESSTTESTDMLALLAGDADPKVRAAAAYAIGYGQRATLTPVLEKLLADKEADVRRGAVRSLLSLDPAASKAVLDKHRKEPTFEMVFTVALAAADVGTYRKDLVRVLKEKPRDDEYYVSQIPAYTGWNILMTYVEQADKDAVQSGEFDDCLDALESPPHTGSGPYQALYRFYMERGLTTRREAFRAKALKEVKGYDLDLFFKQIDGRQ